MMFSNASPLKKGGTADQVVASKPAGGQTHPANIIVASAEVPDITNTTKFPALGRSTAIVPTLKTPKMIFPGRNKSIKSSPAKGPAVAKALKLQPPEPRAVVVEIRVRETVDANESVQVHPCYPLRTLNARLGYFEEKYAGQSTTTTAPRTANADIVEILPWTMDAEAMKCVLAWIRRTGNDDPDTPPRGPTSQLLTRVSQQDHSLTCNCSRRKATTPIEPFHRAKLYRAAGLLRFIGDAANQYRLEDHLGDECKSNHTDAQGANCYDQHVHQLLDFCWDDLNNQWTNGVFIPKLLTKIVDHLEQIDGNKPPATMDVVLTGANQTSFIASVANALKLNIDYQKVCHDYVSDLTYKRQQKQDYEERKRRREQKQSQQAVSSGNGGNQGRVSHAQRSASKVGLMSQEEAEKIHGRRGMSGS